MADSQMTGSRDQKRTFGEVPDYAEEIKKQILLIESYCDPIKWADGDDASMSGDVDDPGFDDNAFGDEDDDNDDEEESSGPRNYLTQSEKLHLIQMLSEISDEDKPLEMVREWAQEGLTLSGKQLLVAIHPDRFQNDSEKEKAHKAFVGKWQHIHLLLNITNTLGAAVENALSENRTVKIEGTNIKELDKLGNDTVDFLEEYHEEAHKEITKPLVQLYDAFKKGESIEKNSPNLTEIAKTAYNNIDKVNEMIREKNEAIHNDPEFGVVEVEQIISCWKPENGISGPSLLWKLCESSHYPMGWVHQPPLEDFSYNHDRGVYWASIRSRITKTLESFWRTLQRYPEEFNNEVIARQILITKNNCDRETTELNLSKKRPENLNFVDLGDIMAHYCGLRCFSATSMNEQLQNLRQHLRNNLVSWGLPLTWLPNEQFFHNTDQKGSSGPNQEGSNGPVEVTQVGPHSSLIRMAPYSRDYEVVPGYTVNGEKIICIQKHTSRFVIEGRDGLRCLADGGYVGGDQALNGALSVNVPYTVTAKDRERVDFLKSNIKQKFRTIYVAMSVLDHTKLNTKGLPKHYTIIGVRVAEQDFHLSRSFLAELVGAKTVEKIIVENMRGFREEKLSNMLMDKLQLDDSPKLLADRPQAALAFRSSKKGWEDDRIQSLVENTVVNTMESVLPRLVAEIIRRNQF
jgi:hypothetical protein